MARDTTYDLRNAMKDDGINDIQVLRLNLLRPLIRVLDVGRTKLLARLSQSLIASHLGHMLQLS